MNKQEFVEFIKDLPDEAEIGIAIGSKDPDIQMEFYHIEAASRIVGSSTPLCEDVIFFIALHAAKDQRPFYFRRGEQNFTKQ